VSEAARFHHGAFPSPVLQKSVTIPQSQLLGVLHEALTRTGQDLDVLVDRLTAISRGDEQAGGIDEVVALGFLACVKAVRETSLLHEVAIREEIQQIHELGETVVTAIERSDGSVRGSRRRAPLSGVSRGANPRP
jgi:hypothetical protein